MACWKFHLQKEDGKKTELTEAYNANDAEEKRQALYREHQDKLVVTVDGQEKNPQQPLL